MPTRNGTVQSAMALTVTPADGPVDGPLYIRLGGMPAGARVTLRACLRDTNGTQRDAFIPVERTQGSMLLISGDDDRMWPSAGMGDQIVERLHAHRYPFRFRHCRYPGAGHLMRPPGVPTSVLSGAFELGGTGPMQARANRAGWTETLAFLGGR